MPRGITGLGKRKGRGEGPQESHCAAAGDEDIPESRGSALGRPDGNRSMPIPRLGNVVDVAQYKRSILAKNHFKEMS
jgi:hypothetical protein